MLKLSIITPSFNRADMVDACVQSVLNQNYPDFEHIIIDGGSTDGTLDLLKKYSHIHVVSERDEGMYDALNKGVELASGDLISFLNTDDLYGKNIFYCVVSLFNDENIWAVAGNAIVVSDDINGNTKVLNQYSAATTDLMECSTIGSNFFNAWFFRRSVFSMIGMFDISYRIAGDKEFMFRFALAGLKYATIDKLIYQYRQHSGSITFGNNTDERLNSIAEQLRMTGFYLKDENVPKHVKALLRQLRTRITTGLAIRYWKTRKFNKIPYYMFTGMQYDLLWLPRFSRALLQRKSRYK
jgi:glycosyltransferase involved in cell wall biosynthesis